MVEKAQISAQVAIEVADGDFLGTTQVARDNRLKISTVFRWIRKGLPAADGGRVRLEALKRGRKWLTSRAALRRFFSALPTNIKHEVSISPHAAVRSPSAVRQRAADDAKEQLKDRFGI